MIQRTIDGIVFEFDTPSILWPVGLPDTQVAFDGQLWWLTSRGASKAFQERAAAIAVIREAWSNAG